MGKEKRDKNQIGFDIDENENKNNIDYEDNKANDKNKINYNEKLKEVDDLKNKVDELTNQFTNFYKIFEECILNDNDGRWKSLYKDMKNEKRSNYVFNVDSLNTKQPDLVVQTQDGRTLVGEVKSKPKATQNELPFFDKKSGTGSFLGGAIGGLFAGVGGLALGVKIGSKFDSKNDENIKKSLIDTRRKFLEEYPVKTYDEFVDRVKMIDPNANDEALEDIKKHDDIDYYNKLLLDIYDNQKSLEQYQIAKVIEENESYKYGIPYIKQDFSLFNMTNNLKDILKDRGISMEKLAELIGVSRNTMTSIINNKGVSAVNMFKISIVLQLPIEQIFKYEPILETLSRENFKKNFEDNENDEQNQ